MNHVYAGCKKVSKLSTDDIKEAVNVSGQDSVEIDKVVDSNGCDMRSLKVNVGYCSDKVPHCKC